MKPIELRKKSADELKALLGERAVRREELVLLSRQHKAKNVKELAAVRRDIARIKTILVEQRS